MTDVLHEWKYTARVGESRRAILRAPGSFKEMVRLVTEDLRVEGVRAKKGIDPGLTDCIQPIFIVDLPRTGDALFNGPWGYRAQYWKGASDGLAANALLLQALAPKLLGSVDTTKVPELARINICMSLVAASAKLWIKETASLLLNPTRDLAIERWMKEAESGAQLAVSGLCAPEESLFEVKGALIDPHGHEVVPRGKIRRHVDIFQFGFS